MSDTVLISVVIPVKNGAVTIAKCLQALQKQTVFSQTEIIIIDSGSTDDTLNILKSFSVRLITIEPETFNHGLTRNIGVDAAKGEFVYFTVQDAALSQEDALEKMLNYFQQEKVAAVSGNQGTPHEKDKNPVDWYKPVSAPTVNWYCFSDPADFKKLSPQQKAIACACDNVNTMYRKATLEQLPFADTVFAEDIIWAKATLLQGGCIIKDSSVVVWHYHHRSFAYAFRVNLITIYYMYKEFEYVPAYPPLIKRIMQVANRLIRERSVSMKEKFYWLGHNILVILADYKAAFMSRRYIRKGGLPALQELWRRESTIVPQGRLRQGFNK